ncbi:proton-conducting transporter transmembrane domain-containing protein [Phytohabitans aurantiacus]|jgi:hydrogenase-4 component F|uniref:Hydrogenase HycQ n=1 Tax=Phytohabitans aurantiacus TaxID=3016789 RepID=A0ABQ5RAY8_9ACTN|nr:proton-conducting transporter membrane subunit [Phytohabitans aurantiacus]GLI02736.1 hydrogenase HycQ [Phytohabitans aurantiacus]
MTPTLALYLPIVAPLAAAGVAALLGRRTAAWVAVPAAASILAAGLWLATAVTGGRAVASGLLRGDALTTFMLIVIGAVATIACWAGVHHLADEAATGNGTPAAARRYLILVQLFLATMSLAVLADNLGLLWVAVEATTIVTAFLVGHRRSRASVEAAWKYVVLCSVGIGIALLGTVCAYATAVAAGAHGTTALNWTYLAGHTAGLDPDLTRLAMGLLLLGFGTKAGLAPMHAWLPDAHSQAPAPVSALMSGVLLSVAFYAIWRYKAITDAVLGPGYTRGVLLVAALASLAVAALLLIAQQDYKRMLAYSSIEHMGMVALGTATGSRLAITAVLLHVLGHGLGKAVAFCGAGQLLHLSGSSRIVAVRGLAARHPALAGVFGLAVVALLGLPPFSLFASEIGIARAGFTGGTAGATAVAFILVLVAFAALTRNSAGILLGAPDPVPTIDPPATDPRAGSGRPRPAAIAPLAIGLAAAAALGISLGPLGELLDSAAATIVGGH